MRNKRGIPQTFRNPTRGIELRRATVFDTFDMSAVLTASIRELCAADHGNDPDRIARWTANKTPAHIRDWLMGDGEYWVALCDGHLAAVGAFGENDEHDKITLNYVDPRYRFRGLSAALLEKLEDRLRARGIIAARVSSTVTALPFYTARGWVEAEPPSRGRWIVAHRLTKTL